MNLKRKQKTRAELEREVKELHAQLASSAHFAAEEIKKLSTDKLMGSAVVIEMSTLGGRLNIGPFAIRDGLSQVTINALIADLIRTYELSVMFKPKPQVVK